MSIDVFPATVLNSTLWNGQTYAEGSFTVTAIDLTVPQTGTVYYVRVGAYVILNLPLLQGTSNNTATFTITGFPTALTGRAGLHPVPVINIAVQAMGNVDVPGQTGAGIMRVLRDSTGAAAWTLNANKTLSNCYVSYELASALSAPGWTGQSYEEGSFVVTATGFSGTAPSGTARYVRVGKQVTVFLPQLSGTSNATTFGLTGWPLALFPINAGNIGFSLRVTNNSGNAVTGIMVMNPPTTVDLYVTPDGGAFTASGTKTLHATSISYVLP